jgi:hypothetical protein
MFARLSNAASPPGSLCHPLHIQCGRRQSTKCLLLMRLLNDSIDKIEAEKVLHAANQTPKFVVNLFSLFCNGFGLVFVVLIAYFRRNDLDSTVYKPRNNFIPLLTFQLNFPEVDYDVNAILKIVEYDELLPFILYPFTVPSVQSPRLMSRFD